MKKILFLLFSLMLVFTLSSCGDTSSSSSYNSHNGNSGGNGNGGNGNGNGGGDIKPEDPLKQLVDSIIGEYTVTAVINGDSNINQPAGGTPFVRINTQDYTTLLIEYKIYIQKDYDTNLEYTHSKLFITNVEKFIKTYMQKTDQGYNFTLPDNSMTIKIQMERKTPYKANQGLGVQGKNITINVNNNNAITEEMPKNIPVVITYDNIKNADLKIYETIGISIGKNQNAEPFIYEVDNLKRNNITDKFNLGNVQLTGNTATYNISATESLQSPYPAYLFDVTIDTNNANTFGLVLKNISQ